MKVIGFEDNKIFIVFEGLLFGEKNKKLIKIADTSFNFALTLFKQSVKIKE